MVSQVACVAHPRPRGARHAQVKHNRPVLQQFVTYVIYLSCIWRTMPFLPFFPSQEKSCGMFLLQWITKSRLKYITLPPRHPQCAFVVNLAAEAAQTLFHRPGTQFLKVLLKVQNYIVNFFVIDKIYFSKKLKGSRMRAAQAGSLGPQVMLRVSKVGSR